MYGGRNRAVQTGPVHTQQYGLEQAIIIQFYLCQIIWDSLVHVEQLYFLGISIICSGHLKGRKILFNLTPQHCPLISRGLHMFLHNAQ